jgi:hypothetical protein
MATGSLGAKLLPRMFGQEIVQAFGELKAISIRSTE